MKKSHQFTQESNIVLSVGHDVLKKKHKSFIFSAKCLFLSFFLSKADHFRTAVRNLRRRKQITFSTLRHADISSSSEKRRKKAYLQADVRLLSKYVRGFLLKLRPLFSVERGKVRHPNIPHAVKNLFKKCSLVGLVVQICSSSN